MTDTNAFNELSAEEEALLANASADVELEEEVIEPDDTPDDPEIDKPKTDEEKAKAKADPEKKKASTVPHGAFHEERVKRQKLERELQDAKLREARFEERLKLIQEFREREEAPKAPDPETDPIAAIEYANRQAEELQRRFDEREQQAAQQAQASQFEQQVISYAQTTVAEFQAETEDYPAAIQHLEQSRIRELKLAGVPENQALNAVRQEALQLAATCAQNGWNVGEVLYGMAEARGYAKKAPDPTADTLEKLKLTQDGQSRNKTLSAAGGKGDTAEMTVERLLSMADDDFHKWCEKNPKRSRALLGG